MNLALKKTSAWTAGGWQEAATYFGSIMQLQGGPDQKRGGLTSPDEWELLFACVHSPPSTERISRLLETDICWDTLLRLARRQGVSALLYQGLRDVNLRQVPTSVLARLQMQFRANAARNQQLMDVLGKLLTLFAGHSIKAIPYKGPVLAAGIYGDLSLRACGDLDILLQPQDVLAAKDLLLAEGFVPQQRFRDTYEEERHLRHDCEYNFQRAADGVLVELHWRFRPGFFPLSLDMNGVWMRAGRMAVGRVTALTLAPEDLLLVLCVHGAKHCWERLGWICDVAALLCACPALDGAALAARARALGCERVLLLGLALAHDLLGVSLPKTLQPEELPAVAALAAYVRRELRTETEDPVGRAWFHLRVRDRIQDRIPYVRHRVRRQLRQMQEDWKKS